MEAAYNLIRPTNFEEMFISTEKINVLRDRMMDGTLPHTILLIGPIGTGKTTLAEIIAKGLNCEGSCHRPCGKCSSCMDPESYITNVNAGSERGIDATREIVSAAYYRPVMANIGVTIFDEAGGLSKDAQRALREITEKPPEFRYIILCTSEPNKIEKDLKDRCFIVDLGSLSAAKAFDFAKYAVTRLNEKTSLNVTLQDNVLKEIVDMADRNARQIVTLCHNYMLTGKHMDVTADAAPDIIELYEELLDCTEQWYKFQTLLRSLVTGIPDAKAYICNLASRTILVSKDNRMLGRASTILDVLLPDLSLTNQKADFVNRIATIWKRGFNAK